MIQSSAVLFRNVNLFDGTGQASFPSEVFVENGRIAKVAPSPAVLDAAGAHVIDGAGATLMPGMVEAHSHLCFPNAVDRIVPSLHPPIEEHVFCTAHNAKTLLEAGFTSAFSAGATRPRIECVLRDEIKAGYQPGPRILASSFERSVSGERVAYEKSLDEITNFVKEMLAVGVDSMKFVMSGRGATRPEHWWKLNYEASELAVVSRMAAEAGVYLSTHAMTPDSIKLAVRAGFRIMYHCNFADEESLDMLEAKKADVFVAPAIGVLVADIEVQPEQAIKNGAPESLDGMLQVIPEMRKRGIRVLPGGDYGFPFNPVGNNARDLALFVEHFGYTPAETLRAATQYGGQLMGMGGELGLVREGYLADLLLIDGDPLADITILQNKHRILSIMQEGRFYKHQAGDGGARQ